MFLPVKTPGRGLFACFASQWFASTDGAGVVHTMGGSFIYLPGEQRGMPLRPSTALGSLPLATIHWPSCPPAQTPARIPLAKHASSSTASPAANSWMKHGVVCPTAGWPCEIFLKEALANGQCPQMETLPALALPGNIVPSCLDIPPSEARRCLAVKGSSMRRTGSARPVPEGVSTIWAPV